MSKRGELDLLFPTGGLDRKLAHRQQPPYTTPLCLNVRPNCVIQKRKRGGSRPGESKFCYEQLGSGNPIRLINTVNVVKSDGRTYLADYFEGINLGTDWIVASWIGVLPLLLSEGEVITTYNANVGAVHALISDLNVATTYQVELDISPYLGSYHGSFSIFARMNDTTPVVTTDGISATINLSGTTGAYTGTLNVYVAGSLTSYSFTSGSLGSAINAKFKVLIVTNNVKVYINSTLLLNQDISAQTGTRIGFGMNCTVSGGRCYTNLFKIQYFSSIYRSDYKKFLCASSNGIFYRESFHKTLVPLTTSLTLSSLNTLQTVDRLQKLYIADFDTPRAEKIDGVINSTGLELTSASISDWTALGILTNDDVVEISAGTGGVTDGVYKISSVVSGKLTLTSSCGTTGTCAFKIQRAPKIYDPMTDTLSLWTATSGKGSVPVGSKLLALYRDRMVFAIGPNWFMSKQGDPLDYNYGGLATDAQRAVSAQETDAGKIGSVITAIIPYSDDYLIWGCLNQLWRLRGDPAYGGQNDNISYEDGIIDKDAWCWGPNSEIIFLSLTGLKMLSSVASSVIQDLSQKFLPDELINIDTNLYEVQLAWDNKLKGVNINLASRTTQNKLQWWFDWETQSLWPEQWVATHQPTKTFSLKSDDSKQNCVLFGCKDGYLRYSDSNNDLDDGTAIVSYVVYGPLRLSKNDYEDGKLNEIKGCPAAGSGIVKWELFAGNSHEECYNSVTAKATGTWSIRGFNPADHPKIRAGSIMIKLSNYENIKWAIENIVAVALTGGKQRI